MYCGSARSPRHRPGPHYARRCTINHTGCAMWLVLMEPLQISSCIHTVFAFIYEYIIRVTMPQPSTIIKQFKGTLLLQSSLCLITSSHCPCTAGERSLLLSLTSLSCHLFVLEAISSLCCVKYNWFNLQVLCSQPNPWVWLLGGVGMNPDIQDSFEIPFSY